MTAIAEVVAGYLAECQRRGVRSRVRAVADRREELVARNGSVETEGVTDDVTVSLMVSDGDQLAVLAGGLDVDLPTVVSEGLAVLRSLSGAAPGGPATGRQTQQCRSWDGRSATPLEKLRGELLGASVEPGARECELRANQVNRTVHYADADTMLTASSSYGQLVLRATRTTDGGDVVHVDRMDSGGDVQTLLSRFATTVAEDARRHLLSPAAPGASPLPGRVVLDASVAAQLICLLGESLSAEAVAQGRSLVGDKLGQPVCSTHVSIIDDPLLPDAPRHLPFDDEGVIGSRTTLVDQGRLRAFFGSRAYERSVRGAVLGGARQPDAVSAPRPAASNLFVAPAATPLDLSEAPTLRIVQTHGMHLSNAITGEFSTGATGLVYAGGETRLVTGLSMAGNVVDVFQRVEAVGSDLCWTDDGDSSFGAPALQVASLSFGR